ncbi:MAG: glycosyltransferase family 4 protein [Clostridia bacterium]|nr:glycosyltransferase family 4 protein [Clostridia bacterium]
MENKQPIKICALTTISKTMDWFIVDSMRNLAANGYEVTLVCNMEEGFAERNGDYATCIHLPMSRGISVSDLIKTPLRLRKIFREGQFDIVYYTSPNAAMYASVASWLAGIKKRVYSQCGLRYVSFTGVRRWVFRFVEKLTCMFSTHVRAQSPMNRQFAIDEKLCPAHKISVVGIGGTTGVSLAQCDGFDHTEARVRLREQYGIAQEAFVFGYVGRVNADKGINELLTAFDDVKTTCQNSVLVLVGMLDDTNPIDADKLERAQADPTIVLTGNVPPSQVYEHMAMFDVLTHPTYREGFGKVLQEAMGMRLPIITTNVPGPSEVVENGVSGVLVEAMDSADLAEKMKLVYKDDVLREKLAAEGRKRAQTYFDRPIMLNNILQDMNAIVEK